jgi:outer membrane protein assembly factor BamD
VKLGNPSPPGVYLSGMPLCLRFLALIAALFLAGCASAPPYQGFTADELYTTARTAFEAGDHSEAQRALDAFLISFPSDDRAAEVRMTLAESYFIDEEYVTALSEYQRFIDRFPSHPSAPDAALGMCRSSAAMSPSIQRDQAYTEEAQQVCSNVATDYPGTAAAAEASRTASEMRLKLAQKLHQIADYYYRRDFNDSAIIYWQMVEEQYADTEWAPRALLGIMNAYQEIGYEDLVAETRQKILDSYPTSEEARALAGGASETTPSGGAR